MDNSIFEQLIHRYSLNGVLTLNASKLSPTEQKNLESYIKSHPLWRHLITKVIFLTS